LGWLETVFLGSLGLLALLQWSDLKPGLKLVVGAVAIVSGLLVLGRLAIFGMRRAIWRLRDRLLVTYLFIAVVPVVLTAFFAQLGAWALSSQVGVYLLNAELERRVGTIRSAAVSLGKAPAAMRAEALRRTGFVFRERYPGLEILLRDERGGELRFPQDSTLPPPPRDWPDSAGVLVRDSHFHAWAHVTSPVEVLMVTPITRSFLLGLVPNLGDVTLRSYLGGSGKQLEPVRIYGSLPGEAAPPAGDMPGAASIFDLPINYGATLPVAIWEDPNAQEAAVLGMRTRISGVLNLLFNQKSWRDQQSLLEIVILLGVASTFLILLAAFVGVSLTRAITSAVHNLYEGTKRIRAGDLAHRIEVKGNDQLAELGKSFNSMAENLERLLKSEKERQRLQAELEIAREVQAQLHPKEMPNLGSLEVVSVCHAARLVSGDYYDYQRMGEHKLAVAIGDVAGKGISAALLMATLQSAMRSQLRHCMEMAGSSPNGSAYGSMSTARLMSNLNQHLYASTAPEKYATFFFSIYDDQTEVLSYTNAGHLPPILVRGGEVSLFDVNGTVVGAFPDVPYEESRQKLESGDLLVCYTDGITEPENEYGEMFGEDRLIEILKAHSGLGAGEVADAVVRAVQEWTASPELQDDMTMLVARKR
jgi:sigma-B regulation protein RsbU (phosphoserine phosphatase)